MKKIQTIDLNSQNIRKNRGRSSHTLKTITLTEKMVIQSGSSQKPLKECTSTLETISLDEQKIISRSKETVSVTEEALKQEKDIKERKNIPKSPQTTQNGFKNDKRTNSTIKEVNKVNAASTRSENTIQKKTDSQMEHNSNIDANIERKSHNKVSKKKKKPKYLSEVIPTDYSQNLLKNIKDIKNGLIITKNNRFFYIMEILPSDYKNRPEREKINILNNFRRFWEVCPRLGHLKCIMEKTDVNVLINRIRQATPTSAGKKMLEIRNDLIKNVQEISEYQSISYRYFYIFEYEGNEQGVKSSELNIIYRQMMEKVKILKDILLGCNNMVVIPEDPNFYLADIIYRLLNRNTYTKESLASRIVRINSDYERYNEAYDSELTPNVADYLAPKGVSFYPKEYMLMDGMYYTWLTLDDVSYPYEIQPDWLSLITVTTKMDVDFFYIKLPHQSTKDILQRKKSWNKVSAEETKNVDKANRLFKKIRNTKYIIDRMEAGEDLFDCCTVITIYDEDPDRLLSVRNEIKAAYRSTHLTTEPSYMDCEEYVYMTMPFLYFENSIFRRNKRNFLTSSMKNVYCFTAYSLFDQTDNSIVIGPNKENGTICAVNKFNTLLHPNPHINITGTTGAGKSFLEMALGRRDYMLGLKLFYIIPSKGHEYLDHCLSLDGEFIRGTPDSDKIYNIMEVFPEMSFSYQSKDSSVKINVSVVARKITSLCTWLMILSMIDGSVEMRIKPKDLSKINQLLTELYEDYGMTSDNDSIWEDKEAGVKKLMPIISDWEARMYERDDLRQYTDLLLPFTSGNFKNFNQHSTIDFTKKCYVFDVEKDDVGEVMLPAVMYIFFDLVTNMIKADKENYKDMFLDECWIMMMNEYIAKIINDEIRLLRSFGGSVITASQQIEDMMRSQFGKTVVSNSSMQFLLMMKSEEFDEVSKVIKLDESDATFLTAEAKQGDMIYICNGNKSRVKLKASLHECMTYETDPGKKANYKKMYLNQLK